MRDDDVPQEGNATLAGHGKAVYARGRDGKLHAVRSAGWEVEEIVTRQAVEELQHQAAAARERARRGGASSLEYHMYRLRMDVALLSQASGIWQWRVRRHLRPAVFARLSPSLKARYADALGMTVDALETVA